MRVTKKLYQQMLEDQDGVCNCCGAIGEELVVDRAYYSREVRGLICKRCQKMLTNVKDSAELLNRLADFQEGKELPPLDHPLR